MRVHTVQGFPAYFDLDEGVAHSGIHLGEHGMLFLALEFALVELDELGNFVALGQSIAGVRVKL